MFVRLVRDEAKNLITIAADGAVKNVLKNSIPYTPFCSHRGYSDRHDEPHFGHRLGQKGEWSLPGETSAKRALGHFERDAGFTHRLTICDGGDPAAAFLIGTSR